VSDSAWFETIMSSGSQLRLISPNREHVSAGKIASMSHGRSAKLK